MEYKVDFYIDTFEFWGGARQVIAQLRKEKLIDEAEALIETAFEDKIPNATEINDYVWFYLEEDLLEMYDKVLWPED